jgi:septum formation protein
MNQRVKKRKNERMQIILASVSERRRHLLSEMGLDFIQVPSFASELDGTAYYREAVTLNAYRKARDVALRYPESLVIGADTVIEFDGKIIGKPEDSADAENILMSLSGNSHYVVTAVSLQSIKTNNRSTFTERTKVCFKPLSKSAINEYLSLVEVLDKAGGYAVQEYGEMLVDSIEGPLDNVIGLPCHALQRALDAISSCGLFRT